MPVARYHQISEDLIQRVSTGLQPVGSLLPTEVELMETYSASRNTVRMALQQLQARGLISRRRNRGTMVEALPGGVANFTQSLSFDDLVTLASTAKRQMIGTEDVVLDAPTAKTLQCQPGSVWYRLSMLRGVEGKPRPLGWTDAYVEPRYRHIDEITMQQPDKLLADLIESSYGRHVETVEQSISACAISAQMSQALGVSKGTPALRVLRHYRDSARALIIVTSSLYPENRYSIVTTLIRNQ